MTKEKIKTIKKFCEDTGSILETDNNGQYIIYTNVYRSEHPSENEEEINESNYTNEEKIIIKLLENYKPFDLHDGLTNSYSALYSSNELYKKFGKISYTVYGKLEEWQDNEVIFIFNFEDYDVFVKVDAIYNSLSDYNFFKDPHENREIFTECNPYIIVRPEYIENIEWTEIESN